MKLKSKIKKLMTTTSADAIVGEIITLLGFEKVMKTFCNCCVFKAYQEKVKKRGKAWNRAARVFHRAIDEVKLEKAGKKVFKINRRDIYECPKCKKKFRVEPELNCAYDVDRNIIVVTCPNCKFKE